MGVSFFDLKKDSNPPAKQSGGSFFDLPQVTQPQRVNEDPNVIDELTNKLGNLGSYTKSILTNPKDLFSIASLITPQPVAANPSSDVASSLGNNLLTSVKGEYEKAKQAILHPLTDPGQDPNAPVSIFGKDNTSNALQPFLHPIDTAAGFVSSMSDQFEKTVGSLTNTVNDNGVARAATPEEQAQNLQSLAGTAAQIALFKGVKGALTMPGTAEEALAMQKMSRLGKTARNMIGEGAAAGVSGAAQGYISNMGNPAQQESAIAQALTYIPVGMAFGLVGRKAYSNELDAAKEELVNKPNVENIRNLASLNGLRVKATSSLSDLTNNIDFINKSDDLVEAELKARLADNDGFVTSDLTPEQATILASKVTGTPKTIKPNYQPIPELADRTATIKTPNGSKMDVDFEHPLDKVAYLSAITKEGKRSKVLQSIIDDAKQQTGLTSQELTNFGKNVREQAKKETPVPRDQATIDRINRETQARGEATVNSSKQGEVLSDSRGNQYVRDGDLIKGQDGTAYPINSQEAHLTLGREMGYEQDIGPNINLKEQPFNTQYGDELHTGINVYHSPVNGSTLITKLALNDQGKSFFESNGFLPGEIVTHGGRDAFLVGGDNGTLKIKDPNTGKVSSVPLNEVRRTTGTLQSLTNSEGFTRIGQLTKETYLDNLYKRYQVAFRNSSDSFAGFNQKFFTENGVKPGDYEGIENYFYKKLADNISQDVLTKDEISTRARMLTNYDALSDERVSDLRTRLDNLAKSNNLVFTTLGAGKYKITTPEAGWKAIVNTPEEAIETINKVKQIGGLALDGGSTNVVNTSIANVAKGGYGQAFSIKERGSLEKLYDQSTAVGLLSKIAPVVRRFASVDNDSRISNFLEPGLKVQDAQLAKKARALQPDFQDLTKAGKLVQNLGKSIPEETRWKIADYNETATADEIANNSLSRPLNSFEKKFASEILRNVDVDQLKTEMFKAKELAKGAKIGSPEYALALKNTITDKARLKAAQHLIMSGQKLGPNLFSPDVVMDYGDALNNPKNHVSKQQFAANNGLTKQHLMYANAIDDYFKQAADIAGIPKGSVLSRYLPRIRTNIIAGSEGGKIPDGFARELERFGITGTDMAERDPQELVRIYHTSLLNHISGFSDKLGEANTQFQDQLKILQDAAKNSADQVVALKQAKQYGPANIEELKANKYAKLSASMEKAANKYISDSRGIPDMDDQTQKAASKYTEALGLSLKSPDQNSVLQLFSLGHIALRPALAFRDIAQSLGNVYISFGHEMASKAFKGSLSQEYMDAMQKKGVIPKMEAGQLIDPGSNGTGGFGSGQGKIRNGIQKLSESSYKLSGQELAYNRVLAGIYKATMDIGERELEKLRTGVITKEQAYERLGLHNHGPSIQAEFDKLVTNGRPDQALDYLGKWNGRYAANYFGMANAPSGWNTNFGRLLGQYGSWSANATHTILEQSVRGNKQQIMGKLMRAGVVIGAAYATEKATGLKVHNWAAGNPLTTLPGVGPVVNQSQDIMDEWQRTGDPSAMMKVLKNDALGFIPYNQAYNDWKKAYELITQGDIRGVPQATGIQIKR